MITNNDHRGQTVDGKYTYRPRVQYEPSDFPGDSVYWKIRARTAVRILVDKIGVDAYNAWVDTLPDEGNFKTLCEAVEKKIQELNDAE